ncbi:hypothetical protein C0416_00150 [bacterium]|nr:hypothetical protein [bacterium]
MRIWYKLTKQVLLISIAILFMLMLLLLGLITFDQNTAWFSTLKIPSIQPSSLIFILVWTAIYVMIAISVIIVLGAPKEQSRHKTIAIALFLINGILNGMYSILFFGMQSILLAFIELPLLITFVVLLIMCTYRINKIASYMLIPYFLWICFATILTGMILFMN